MEHLTLSVCDNFEIRYFENAKNNRLFREDDDFFEFPNDPAFHWNEESCDCSTPGASVNQFLQQWLFFGLLRTVLQDRSFKESDFTTTPGNTSRTVHTKFLNRYLETWGEEASVPNHETTMWMIKAQLALDKAREVVSKFSWDWSIRNNKEDNDTRYPYIDQKLALSLMVLGETLSNVKCQIVERYGFTIRGWHGDANEGWGIPSIAVTTMIDMGWCERTVYVLTCQLKSHATALLAAWNSFRTINPSQGRNRILNPFGHSECNKHKCIFKSIQGSDKEKYKTQHRPGCNEDGCPMIGPEPFDVAKIIDMGQLPILRYEDGGGNRSTVHVRAYKPEFTYATISHVWSDGYGNRDASELPKCQLDFISRVVRDSPYNRESPPFFWIDTLAIPHRDKYPEQRKKAVQRIDEIYRNSKFTIVLELGLDQISTGNHYHEIAMRILVSGWMRRLWTLQEAYLSKKILFRFSDKLMDLDDIEEMYPHSQNDLQTNLSASAQVYFRHIMGPERRSRMFGLALENSHDLIASVWRSTQWRVLFALFELNAKSPNGTTEMPGSTSSTDYRQPKSSEELFSMMKRLWALLDEQSPGCIPSGIIFVPGKRLPLKGFGWAPATWMSGQHVDYPDPLSLLQQGARIVYNKGLSVTYPGFILHSDRPETVFWPKFPDPIRFPSDSTLLEWYEVECVDEAKPPIAGRILDGMNFAILLCRQKPREVKEIALLVHIARKVSHRIGLSKATSKVMEAHIVCRVWIKRDIKIDRSSIWEQFSKTRRNNHADFICAEELDNTQEWLVDGRKDTNIDEVVEKSPGQSDEATRTPVKKSSASPDGPPVRSIRVSKTPFASGRGARSAPSGSSAHTMKISSASSQSRSTPQIRAIKSNGAVRNPNLTHTGVPSVQPGSRPSSSSSLRAENRNQLTKQKEAS
ncbi:uncharacterized protein CC84DRAFT_1207606 [Paraphaeosphaeria sporulosa]|uniref:Heterokaryon incompatibility domain-containing protein n=1 Tax=Paraphaeosphaeria sporulosa TaxID=1460663 RepID=A0A177C7T1_9PLEO|nr:uncharacterized protein CC84DRAFT_1207606 [Paraphaeosphaeria sporulosa]OAG02760.1 hypothetical protein CC84DRAFT_1207606 [Paraphaeosphaeria sporulosa]